MNFALISFSIAVSGKPPYLGNKFRSSAQARLAQRIRVAVSRIWTSRVAILFLTFMPIILARSGLATRSICDTSKTDTTARTVLWACRGQLGSNPKSRSFDSAEKRFAQDDNLEVRRAEV